MYFLFSGEGPTDMGVGTGVAVICEGRARAYIVCVAARCEGRVLAQLKLT